MLAHKAMQAPVTLLILADDVSNKGHVALWPISEVATCLIEVRSLVHSRLDLLTLSSSPFDPKRKSGAA